MKKKFIFFIFFLFFFTNLSFSSPLLSPMINLNIPSKKSFKMNTQFIRPFNVKRITVAEYLTDPLILYSSLWGCFALTLPIWETNAGLVEGDENYWEPDSYRGFYLFGIDPENVYISRITLEPFGANHQNIKTLATYPGTIRSDPITKQWNDHTVLRNDFYAKNIIEPLYYTYLGLYLRAKNYHPAIMVTEMILLSVLYELTIRPFFMNGSIEQLFKNPAIGIVLAILLDELSNFLLSTPYVGLHVLAYFLNPFNALPNARIHPMIFFDPYKKAASLETIIKF
ncbi:MAG: hypothetical protein JXB50_01325 [Spirochaetes bacterium]|nr:hypothetical protein [Spirochaetota bacterium]